MKGKINTNPDLVKAIDDYKKAQDQYNLAVFAAEHANDGKTLNDPMTQMILDSQKAGLKA